MEARDEIWELLVADWLDAKSARSASEHTRRAYAAAMGRWVAFLQGQSPAVALWDVDASHVAFAPQVESFALQGYQAVAWDMPGYGHSPPVEPYDFKGLAARCVALIEALAPYRGPKGNLIFPLNQPLPVKLIGRVAVALHAEYLSP